MEIENKGSILEGLSTEIGGLMQQATKGKVEHLRKRTTNQQDEGVDYEREVDKNFHYFEFLENLKKKHR